MLRTQVWAALVAGFVLVAFAGWRTAVGQEETAAPRTVKAFRYRPKLVESAMDFVHGGGVACDELFFPDRKVVANVSASTDAASGHVLHAFPGEIRTSHHDLATHTTIQLPTEEIEVPAEFAEGIFELAELTQRQSRLAMELAAKGLATRTFRDAEDLPATPAERPR